MKPFYGGKVVLETRRNKIVVVGKKVYIAEQWGDFPTEFSLFYFISFKNNK